LLALAQFGIEKSLNVGLGFLIEGIVNRFRQHVSRHQLIIIALE
jgi:hypothetical protein